MRLISTLLFIGIIMVPLISSQTNPSDDDFSLPSLEDLKANLDKLWADYKKGFGIIITSTAEEIHRFRIFKKNLKLIIKHNVEYHLGLHTYRLGVTNHTEWTEEEFRQKFYGYTKDQTNASAKSPLLRVFTPTPVQTSLPAFMDWRKDGIITPVKDQAQCGSCWAFSTVAALEAYHARASGELLDLSEQQLVDCSRKYRNEGCNGGYPAAAFQYMHDNKGVTYEESYPYFAKDGTCKTKGLPFGPTVDGYVQIPSGDEYALQEAVAHQGPVVVAIDAGLPSFRWYKSGVYSDRQCSTTQLNHAVLVVGYGAEWSPIYGTQQYYIIKNSWSSQWGENGYIKIARNKGNMCGISTDAVYPVVTSKMSIPEPSDI